MPHGTGRLVEEYDSYAFVSPSALQGCDVLAKNDRGHTPFALCTDPDVRPNKITVPFIECLCPHLAPQALAVTSKVPS